jgi:osmoprotectant transport system ATP-binding protein
MSAEGSASDAACTFHYTDPLVIVLDRASKSYDGGATFAVREVSLRVEKGEFVVLLGTSGCGKTTTLKMVNRLIDATSGAITVDGKDIAHRDPVALRRSIGYVFQGIGLFPHMTVGENIAVVPRLLSWAAKDTHNRVTELLQLVKLPPNEFRGRMPKELSGGQQQRVGLARALAARPRIMLMDEPFGALDPLTRDALQDEYRDIHRSLSLTTIMVTHDMTEALLLADRIGVMDRGRILQLDTPHELLVKPANDYVRQLMNTPKRQADRLEELAGEVAGGGA